MYQKPNYTKANPNDFEVGMEFYLGAGIWGNNVTVIKVTPKAIQVQGKEDKVANIKPVSCWFPKSAIMWREEEELETAEIAEWLDLSIWQLRLIGMAE